MANGEIHRASLDLSPDAFNRSLRIYTNFSLSETPSELAYSFGSIKGSFSSDDLREKGFSEQSIQILEKLMALPGVSHLKVSSTQITVYKFVPEEWSELLPEVEKLIADSDIEIKPVGI